MRVVFIATGEIAVPSLRHLVTHGPVPVAVVTQPDKPAGRRQVLTPPPVKTEALAAGIPVLQPERVGDCAAQLAALAPDVIVVMAYGQILREDILSLPRLAIVNLHASLLPRHRGAACIQAAIDAGDAVTGITSMHVVHALDAGDIILAESLPIADDETGGSLHDRLAALAADVLERTLARLADGTAPRVPQDPLTVTYVPKLGRDDGRIDWALPAPAIERRIRAYDPWPGTFCTALEPDGSSGRLKIFPPTTLLAEGPGPGACRLEDGRLVVGCGEGALELHCVQPEGGRRMAASEYLRGRHPVRLAP